jgi:uncharacterized repeat protein (TIGR02543 family)
MNLQALSPVDSLATWTKRAVYSHAWEANRLQLLAEDFTKAIEQNPSDWNSRIFRSIALGLSLAENESAKAYFQQFGYAIDFGGILSVQGERAPAAKWPAANAVADDALAECKPVLGRIIEDLCAIPETWEGVVLSSEKWPIDETVRLDYADVQYLKAQFWEALGMLYFATAYDIDYDYVKSESFLLSHDTQRGAEARIPVLASAPSLTSDAGWENAALELVDLGDGNKYVDAIRFAFYGNRLYVRFVTKPGAVLPKNVAYAFYAELSIEDGPDFKLYFDEYDTHSPYEDSKCWWLDWNWDEPYGLSFYDNGKTLVFDMPDSVLKHKGEFWIDWVDVEVGTAQWIEDEWYGWLDFEELYEVESQGDFFVTARHLMDDQTGVFRKVRNKNQLIYAREYFRAALNQVKIAMAADEKRTGNDLRLFECSIQEDYPHIKNRVLKYIDRATESLDSVTIVELNDFYYRRRPGDIDMSDGFGKYFDAVLSKNSFLVSFAPLFNGLPLREYMPKISFGKYCAPMEIDISSCKDPTFAGMTPEATDSFWYQIANVDRSSDGELVVTGVPRGSVTQTTILVNRFMPTDLYGLSSGGNEPGPTPPAPGPDPDPDPDPEPEPEPEPEPVIFFEMNEEYRTGNEIEVVIIRLHEGILYKKIAVTGLPSGLKFTAKDILRKGSKTEVEYPANTIYGTPTKSGIYTIVATATTADKKTVTYLQTIVVRKAGEKIVNIKYNTNAGKVMGAGVYLSGKKVTLKATANKGYVFAGWYEDEAFTTPCDSTVVDYRTISYSYTMGNEDKTFYARFIPVAADALLDLTVDGENVPTTFTISEYAQLSLDVDSLSLPKISVKGLPAGMKFTAKPIYKKGSKTEIEVPANTIYGAPTKPGNAEIQVSLSNQSIKKAIVKQFIIEVPNLTGANSYFVDNLDNSAGKKCVLSVGITNIDDFLPSLKLKSNAVKLAVKGLPSGLKYDAKTGKITGIATKAGAYTVTLTVTEGKAKYVSTIAIKVEALPDWVVGTFNGYIDGSESYAGDWVDWVTITINSSGKVSYKDITEDGSIYIVNPKDITFKQNESGDYIIETDQRGIDWYDKKELRISFVIIDGVTVGVIEGESKGADIEDGGAWIQPAIGEFYACQNVWKSAQGTRMAPDFIKNTTTSVSMSRMRDDDWDSYYGGYLILKYGANGAVTTAYSESEGGKATATGSVQLVPYEVDGNITKAWLYTALKPKGRDAFGVLLFLSIDTSNGNVYGDDVTVEDYLLEVDD